VSLACIRGCAIARRHLTDCEHPDDGQCRGCLVRTLREIPNVWFLLQGHLAPGSTARSGDIICRTKGDAPPAPLNVAVLDLMVQIDHIPDGWARVHAEEHDLQRPSDGIEHLATHLASVECSEWIADAWDELTGLVSHAHALVPWRPEAVKLGAPCPQCHCQALVLYGGDDWVTCQECGYVINRSLYDHWARVILDEQREATAA
jgi:Zn ribbon nucleic-acid-binding protein